MTAEISKDPTPKPLVISSQYGYLQGGKINNSKIFDQFANLGEPYVFFITVNGKELRIPQKQLLQFVNSIKDGTVQRNLLAFFTSANLARLSRLPQGLIHKIDLNAVMRGEDPIKKLEEGNPPSKLVKNDNNNVVFGPGTQPILNQNSAIAGKTEKTSESGNGETPLNISLNLDQAAILLSKIQKPEKNGETYLKRI